MPLIYAQWYTRTDIKNNPDKLYIFGDNFEQRGFGGQAKEARGEPNAIGIPTKRRPTMEEDAFLTDADWDEWFGIVDPIFKRIEAALEQNRVVIWPMAGIGTLRAELPKRAPRIFEAIKSWVHINGVNWPELAPPARGKPISDFLTK
jgi:hypothetical protein